MFEIRELNNGEFQIILRAGNKQVILRSEPYFTKAVCINVIGIIKRIAQEGKFEKLTSSNGKPYFILKAHNGQIMGTSDLYESNAARDNGIELVKKYAV